MASEQYINYYVDDYIQDGYHTEELYFDGDYLVAGYYEGEEIAPQEASADFTVAATLAVDILSIEQAEADLSVTATATATVTRIQPGSSSLDSVVTQTVSSDKILDADSAISANFAASPKIGKLQIATIDTIVAFTPTVLTTAFKNHTAILDARSTLTAQPESVFDSTVTLDNIVNQSLQADRTRADSANYALQFEECEFHHRRIWRCT